MSKVFVEQKDVIRPGYTVGVLMNNPPKKGKVGLEIEVEGKNLLYEDEVPPPWKMVPDHSLRGEENAEYILKSPIEFSAVEKALDNLWEAFRKKKTRLDESNRTSVHVHLNCQDFHLNRLAAFVALYYQMEEILTEWCGDHRVGNLFCLRGKDAPAVLRQLRQFIAYDGNHAIHDKYRYAALNPNALSKYGSIEVRTLRGCTDPRTIKDFVSILERLYHLSSEFPDPREICTMLSSMGPIAMFDNIAGDKAQLIRDGISFTNDRIAQSMYEGIRLAQDICYCKDWEKYKKQDFMPDPFGRSSKAMIKKLQQQPVAVTGEESVPVPPSAPAALSAYTPYFSNMVQAAEEVEMPEPYIPGDYGGWN